MRSFSGQDIKNLFFKIMVRGGLIILLTVIMQPPLFPQSGKNGLGWVAGAGSGVLTEGFVVNDEITNRTTGIPIVLLAGLSDARRVFFLLELELHPYDIVHADKDLSYRANYLMISGQYYFGKAFFFKALLGPRFRSFSGGAKTDDSDVGVAFGLSLGYEFALSKRFALSADLGVRFAFLTSQDNPDGDTGNGGLRIAVLRYF